MKIILCAILILAGCASNQPQANLAPPQITIEHTTKKQVLDYIAERTIEGDSMKGFRIFNTTDYGITLAKKIEGSLWASYFYGSRYDTNPEGRITYNTVQKNDNVLVVGTFVIVTNPGSGFERVSDVTNQSRNDILKTLAQLKSKVENLKSTNN